MTSNPDIPYSNLTPDMILNAIESIGVRCSGSVFPLNSYENRVFQVGLDEGAPLIAKFYRPGRWTDEAIIEEHQFALGLAALEIPVIAPIVTHDATLHQFDNYRFALFPKCSGRPLELDNLDQLEWMGRYIGRIHAVGSTQAFTHRMQLTVDSYGKVPYRYLLEHDFIPALVKPKYCAIVDSVLQKCEQIFEMVGSITPIRLHGDCHAGNVLWNNGPFIVDLDDCLMGPAVQDLWMLLSGDPAQMQVQLNRILDGYCEFHDYQPTELRLVEVLRSLRLLHYSAWLAKRWHDPAFPMNFPWFNTENYWHQQCQHLQEQEILLDQVLELR